MPLQKPNRNVVPYETASLLPAVHGEMLTKAPLSTVRTWLPLFEDAVRVAKSRRNGSMYFAGTFERAVNRIKAEIARREGLTNTPE